MNVKSLIANKGIGYWLCLGASVAALIMAIIIFATQSDALPNTVTGQGVNICIPLLIGVVLQVALTFFPIKFAGVISAICYTIAFGVTVNTIPNAVADYFNKVAYTGGSFGMCMFYAVATLVIAIVSVAACFFTQTKDGKTLI